MDPALQKELDIANRTREEFILALALHACEFGYAACAKGYNVLWAVAECRRVLTREKPGLITDLERFKDCPRCFIDGHDRNHARH